MHPYVSENEKITDLELVLPYKNKNIKLFIDAIHCNAPHCRMHMHVKNSFIPFH